MFGINFNSDDKAAATINDPMSRMDPTWGAATAKFVLRGTDVTLTVTPSQNRLQIKGVGPKQTVRVISGGEVALKCIGTPC